MPPPPDPGVPVGPALSAGVRGTALQRLAAVLRSGFAARCRASAAATCVVTASVNADHGAGARPALEARSPHDSRLLRAGHGACGRQPRGRAPVAAHATSRGGPSRRASGPSVRPCACRPSSRRPACGRRPRPRSSCSGGASRPIAARRQARAVPCRAVVVLEVLLWVSLALILWTHVGYPLLAALLARVARRPVRAGDALPRVALVITAHNEADVIAEKLENALGARLPARAAAHRRHVRRLQRRHRRHRPLVRRPRRRPRRRQARRQGQRAGHRRARARRRHRRGGVLGRELDLVAGRAAPAAAPLRRPRRRLRLRPPGAAQRRRDEPGGRVLAARGRAARPGVGDRLDHRRQRLDLRRPPRGLRRGRPALGATTSRSRT